LADLRILIRSFFLHFNSACLFQSVIDFYILSFRKDMA
jgi:hypothetical protein